ncbi:riboflavin synthase [bacterium]|nr:MAG: riboflavin synthase [bacterium]
MVFTGLIHEIGRLESMTFAGGHGRLSIRAPHTAAQVAVGQSVAVQGICLTVTARRGQVFTVDAAAETRRLTTLSNWRRGERLHLEPALRAGDPLDGHLVQGHVDGTGKVLGLRHTRGSLYLTVGLATGLARFLTPKGSVAVDGVSLTVDAGPHTDRFTVNLIPHTMRQTAFADLRMGRPVNLEMDVLVKAARTGEGALLPGAGNTAASPLLDRLLARGFGRLSPKGRT